MNKPKLLKSHDEQSIGQLKLQGESYFKIANSDEMRPFLMTIVSDTDHWMFVSSNGGLTAGRKNPEHALFPYYTDDKLTDSVETTGSKTILRVQWGGQVQLWEPFSVRDEGRYACSRNLYKNYWGNKILFEEINHDLGLTFRYSWQTSGTYGFIKKATLINHNGQELRISLLDGVQNIMPSGAGSDIQTKSSNLVDAYKRCERIIESGLGLYALSAMIVDKAEPSEALKANVAWSLGFDSPKHLLSSLQLDNFRKGLGVVPEHDIKAEKGAYLVATELLLAADSEKEWLIVANVNQNHSAIVKLSEQIINDTELYQKLHDEVNQGTKNLKQLVGAADGFQKTADDLNDARHFSNTLFNIMRGGVFDDHYRIEKWDFTTYFTKANGPLSQKLKKTMAELPEQFTLGQLQKLAYASKDLDFERLCLEYLPLKFSRRHGDPSRPWNRFSINTRNELDGSKILDYEGNWRDIFQNWEALAHSYPQFVEGMVHKFLNATTFDGYNPYRITKDGFDWEVVEPDDPWSYIGYWGDHQIIYLLKFLEFQWNHAPETLAKYFDKKVFVYANVPYRIKEYADLLKNPKDTISFDHGLDVKIRQDRYEIGADGALLHNQKGGVQRATFIEKILATLLAKLSNFIPEGGIWMNTQRPEWNDANNALVGNGVSMVTLCYLRRFLAFFNEVLPNTKIATVTVSTEINVLFQHISEALFQNVPMLGAKITNGQRKLLMDDLGEAASQFRNTIYQHGFSGNYATLELKKLQEFVETALKWAEHSINSNKRNDGLYHAYNLMTVVNNEEVSLAHLQEMLEGQVAVLSAGQLSPEEALQVLDALKRSALFRDDQYSYLLYPNKELPRFMDKNTIPAEMVAKSKLLKTLVEQGNAQIIEQDIKGAYHFNGSFRNADDLLTQLDALSDSHLEPMIKDERASLSALFEEVFNHKEFTGRSGTFYGYEGLGSIYWHMVSKLQLAVAECCTTAIKQGASAETTGRLLAHFYEINAGIGVHKSPALYGAFPTDAYSHTPMGKGAQQPGMTGQVKEDILSRFIELGVSVKEGCLEFKPQMLRKDELLKERAQFTYTNVQGTAKVMDLAPQSLCFTYCQVPVVYQMGEENGIAYVESNGTIKTLPSLKLDRETSEKLFWRSGEIERLTVSLKESCFR